MWQSSTKVACGHLWDVLGAQGWVHSEGTQEHCLLSPDTVSVHRRTFSKSLPHLGLFPQRQHEEAERDLRTALTCWKTPKKAMGVIFPSKDFLHAESPVTMPCGKEQGS